MYKYQEEFEKRYSVLPWSEWIRITKFECEMERINPTPRRFLQILREQFLNGASANLKSNFDRHYEVTLEGIKCKDKESAVDALPILKMPCIDCDYNKAGIYFVAMIGITPDNHKYYLIKNGKADHVKDRIKQYASHNPMIYHNNCYLPIDPTQENILTTEANCHEYIAKRAYARAQNTKEWFYVDEKTYYELCDTFANHEKFRAIGNGEL
jgi:hypothetical protein